MQNDWMTRQRYCTNCGTLGICYGVGENRLRFKCSKCLLESFIVIKNRRNSSVEEYLPRYVSMLQELGEYSPEEEMGLYN